MKRGRITKYFIFSKAGAQTVMAYRGQIFLWVLGAVITAVLMGLLWWAIFEFSDGDTVGGYSYPQMLLYVILSAAVAEVTFSDTMGMIVDDVRYGQIAMRLMKPISYRAQLAFTGLGLYAARLVIFGVPMIAAGTLVAVFGFGLSGLEWYNIVLFVPATFVSMLVAESFDFLFGQLAFRTQAMFGVNSMVSTVSAFLSGRLIPIALFPLWAQTALAFTPFPSMTSMPVRIFLGVMPWRDVLMSFGIAVAWIVVLNVLGWLFYKTSVRKVVVFGG